MLAERPDNDDLLKEAFGVESFNDGLAGFELRKRALFSPTCNIAGLASGYAGEGTKTVLPARAMAKIDFRLVPDQDPDDILAKLRPICKPGGTAISLSPPGPTVGPRSRPSRSRWSRR